MGRITSIPDSGGGGLTSIDSGLVRDLGATGATWTDLRTGVATATADFGQMSGVGFRSHVSTLGSWRYLSRLFFSFDTSGCGGDAAQTGSTLALYIDSKQDGLGAAPSLAIYSSSPAAMNDLALSDFTSIGSTPLSNIVNYADIPASGLLTFVLNAAGAAQINPSGVSAFVVRTSHDANNVTPPSVVDATTEITVRMVDYIGFFDPTLTVFFGTPPVDRAVYASFPKPRLRRS